MRIQREVPILAEGSCRSATPVFKGVQIGPSLKLQEEKRQSEDDAGNTPVIVLHSVSRRTINHLASVLKLTNTDFLRDHLSEP